MRPLIQEISTAHTPESLVGQLHGEPGLVLLRSALFDSPQARYSFIAARPFLRFRSFGSRCEIVSPDPHHAPRIKHQVQFGNPWQLLDALLARCELLDEIDLPFPLGGCFGYWGNDLKNFVEPKLPRRAVNDLELPDCHVGFYDSLVVFDHRLGKVCIVSTGLDADGSRSEARAAERLEFWNNKLAKENPDACCALREPGNITHHAARITSNLSRADFIAAVERTQRYIRAGDIYQANLSQRLTAQCDYTGWELFQKLNAVSPAPFSAFIDCGEFEIA